MEMKNLLLERVNEDLRSALAQSVRADQEKADYMAQITRSFRTPMNTISGMAMIARHNIDDQEKVLDCLDKIDLSSQQLAKLVNEITDMSELDDRAMLMNESPFCFGELLWQTISQFVALANEKNISIWSIADKIDHDHLVGDCDRIKQILGNILSNAINYTMPGGKITITVEEVHAFKDGNSLFHITIEDTGIGMTAEFMDKLYRPFVRADDPRIAEGQGVGLGLPISMRLVRMMSGDIKASSEPEVGSKFVISLHLRRQEEVVLDKHGGAVVLILDRDDTEAAAITEILRGHEMEPVTVRGSADLHTQIETRLSQGRRVDAVIIAFGSVGDQGGYRTVKELNDKFGDKLPPLIFITDWWESSQKLRMADMRHAFITRPINTAKIGFAYESICPKRAPLPRPGPVETSLAGKRVLVAEDNELNAEMIKEILEEQGIIVEVAGNGVKVLDMLMVQDEYYYDCILMDIKMPVMDGYVTTRRIRGNTRNDIATLPIIAMTADAYSIDIRSAKNAGMDAHIAKPINIDEMLAMFAKLIR